MNSVADEVRGPLFAYLGHFRQRKFLLAGHNDVGEGENNDDARMNQYFSQNYGGTAPNPAGLPGAMGYPNVPQ